MKVQFKNMLKAYSGTCDGLVYYYNPRIDKVVCRKNTRPKESSSNRRLSAISKNLKSLHVSDGYKEDLKLYVAMFEQKHHEDKLVTWSNAFNKLMFAMAKQNNLDLAILTREQIYANNLPCISIAQSVEAGLLPHVDGYQRLMSNM